jgi:hypothetical protein
MLVCVPKPTTPQATAPAAAQLLEANLIVCAGLSRSQSPWGIGLGMHVNMSTGLDDACELELRRF